MIDRFTIAIAIEQDSISFKSVSSRGRVGVESGSGSYGDCLRVKSGRVGLGSGSSRGRVGVAWGFDSVSSRAGSG